MSVRDHKVVLLLWVPEAVAKTTNRASCACNGKLNMIRPPHGGMPSRSGRLRCTLTEGIRILYLPVLFINVDG